MFATWLLGTALLAVVVTATPDTEYRVCRQCQNDCETSGTACPIEKPFCATHASSPNFTSTLTCAAATTERPCLLTYYEKQKYEITCICTDNLCNAPFSREMRDQLINFTSSNSMKNTTGNVAMFWKLPHFANTTTDTLYKSITTGVKVGVAPAVLNDLKVEEGNKVSNTVIVRVPTTTLAWSPEPPPRPVESLPRAHELKATAPSDDDEDESEGSGTEEELARTDSAPDTTSSHLPAAAAAAPPPLLLSSPLLCLLPLYI